jgi:hypothetical protein
MPSSIPRLVLVRSGGPCEEWVLAKTLSRETGGAAVSGRSTSSAYAGLSDNDNSASTGQHFYAGADGYIAQARTHIFSIEGFYDH